MASVPQPPKFANPGKGPMPQTIGEGLDFFRWLFLQWRKVEDATTDQQVRTLIPQQPGTSGAQAFEESVAFQRARPSLPRSNAFDAGAASAFASPHVLVPDSSEIANIAFIRASRPPFRSFAQAAIIEDTHAARLASYPANSYPVGTLFWETDRTVYYLNIGALGSQNWVYTTGEFSCAQAALPGDLGTHDGGFLANVFDYGHLLIWSGAAWTWGPGDAGSGMLQLFEVDPTGAGWHLYDGSTVNYLKADGTLGSITLPNISGAAPTRCYLKTSDTNGGPTSPTAPTFTGGAVTGATFTGTPAVLTGTNTAPTFTGTPGTPTGTFTGAALATHSHDSPIGAVSATIGFFTADFGTGGSHTVSEQFTIASSVGSANVQKTSAVTAGTPAGTLAMNAFTPAGTNSAPALTMNSYTPAGTISGGTSAGTIGTNGEPENLTRRAFFRQ